MINEIIYWELYALVVSFFNGVLLAWIYDNIRAFRRIVRHKTVAFMSVEDIMGEARGISQIPKGPPGFRPRCSRFLIGSSA